MEEIYRKLGGLLAYDEYEWQREQGMRITAEYRAQGLHLPLYQCLCCGAEHQMASEGSRLLCKSCGAEWEMDELGRFERIDGAKEGSGKIHIPDWYEWQRANVVKEIERGQYGLDARVRVEALPNAVNFIGCGEGRLVHGIGGFRFTFTDYLDGYEKTLVFPPAVMSSIHTEYDYRGQGQCVTLSVPDNTYFLFPLEAGFNATKIQFAVEHLYERRQNERRTGGR